MVIKAAVRSNCAREPFSLLSTSTILDRQSSCMSQLGDLHKSSSRCQAQRKIHDSILMLLVNKQHGHPVREAIHVSETTAMNKDTRHFFGSVCFGQHHDCRVQGTNCINEHCTRMAALSSMLLSFRSCQLTRYAINSASRSCCSRHNRKFSWLDMGSYKRAHSLVP